MLNLLLIAAVCLSPPVQGEIIAGYAPVGSYGGHWGVDYVSTLGGEVRAPASGRVTFAGSVAGMQSITIEPVVGFKVSVSYLSRIDVAQGDWVWRGGLIGFSGIAHGLGAVHMSTRIAGRYVDPIGQMGCRDTEISRALRLVTPPQPYPRRRENRNTGRNLRSDSHRPSPRSRDGAPRGRSGPGPVRSRW